MKTAGFFFDLITFSAIFSTFIIALNIKIRTKDRLVTLYLAMLILTGYHTFYPLVTSYLGRQRITGIPGVDFTAGLFMLIATYGMFFVMYLLIIYLSGVKERRLFSIVIFIITLIPFGCDLTGFTRMIFNFEKNIDWIQIPIIAGFWLFFIVPPLFLVLTYKKIPPGHLKKTTKYIIITLFIFLFLKITNQILSLTGADTLKKITGYFKVENLVYISLCFIITGYMVRYYFHKYDQLIDSKMLETFCTQKQVSDREKEILIFIADGLSNKEIAYELKITENTVKKHIQNIMKKSNTASRLQLISEIRRF